MEIVRASDVTLRVLETIAFAPGPMGVTAVAQKVGIAKSGALTHLHTLMFRGYLLQDPDTNRYTLGPKAWLFAQIAPPTDDLAQIAEGAMKRAREETGMSVVLSIPTRTSVFVLQTLHNLQAVEIGVRRGSELPLHASAQGKVALAFGSPELKAALHEEALVQLTPHTITDPEALRREVERVRELGYASAPEQVLLGVNTIAAPIFDRSGALVACVGLVGSIQHLSETQEQVSALLRMSRSVSASIGGDQS
jgi:IclR family transcriptional regulator, KDG regulon repressor